MRQNSTSTAMRMHSLRVGMEITTMQIHQSKKLHVLITVTTLLFSFLLVANVFAQETTGGLQGTVKDPTGAVVPKATIEVTGSALGGAKSLETDASGYYRF